MTLLVSAEVPKQFIRHDIVYFATAKLNSVDSLPLVLRAQLSYTLATFVDYCLISNREGLGTSL